MRGEGAGLEASPPSLGVLGACSGVAAEPEHHRLLPALRSRPRRCPQALPDGDRRSILEGNKLLLGRVDQAWLALEIIEKTGVELSSSCTR